MNHKHDGQCKCAPTVAAQSLDEMEFERGIWSAGMVNFLYVHHFDYINCEYAIYCLDIF